jgi:hypothetical protein
MKKWEPDARANADSLGRQATNQLGFVVTAFMRFGRYMTQHPCLTRKWAIIRVTTNPKW